MGNIALALHGGAGTIRRGSMTPEQEAEYRRGLSEPLELGRRMLLDGANALDAVVAVVAGLEDNPLFNAGRGSVFTADGTHEMDAAVMRGIDREAGGVAGVSGIRNPVLLAREVMLQSEHVLLAADGALRFARSLGIPAEPDEYFHTDERYRQLLDARQAGRVQLDHSESEGAEPEGGEEKKFGTVGAVARDLSGHLAAATSTGGMTNKMWGRIGDSPLIGAGTWADDATCAVSCTGHGEFFIRNVVAYDLAALMEYRQMSLADAAEHLVMTKLLQAGGEGGLIAVGHSGDISLPFNSEGMYRGWTDGISSHVAIYRDSEEPRPDRGTG